MKIITIGVYGFSEKHFFDSLLAARVDTFCDLRLRRGMRGSQYSFVNSQHLQTRLAELGIRYIHIKELAPSIEVRNLQKLDDANQKLTKSSRTNLAPSFIEAYKKANLSKFSPADFSRATQGASVVALFCVEREPHACHRSVVAEHLHQEPSNTFEDILP